MHPVVRGGVARDVATRIDGDAVANAHRAGPRQRTEVSHVAVAVEERVPQAAVALASPSSRSLAPLR